MSSGIKSGLPTIRSEGGFELNSIAGGKACYNRLYRQCGGARILPCSTVFLAPAHCRYSPNLLSPMMSIRNVGSRP
jgi:hypothetical protein